MMIKYIENKELPSLAWCAYIENGVIRVCHGLKVEINQDFFVEGAWADDYSNVNFDSCEWFCGTGAILRDSYVVFASPTGMHAALYYTERKDGTQVISNSLPYIMASEEYAFDPQWLNYETDFNYNILQGIYKYNPNVHVVTKAENKPVADNTIQMILYRNIFIDNTGRNVDIRIKPSMKGFDCFEEYYTRLVSTMKALAANASDSNRKYKYGITSLISSGYDAACCSAIAREAGAKKVLTFEAKGKYKNDSGVSAAKYLGFEEIIEKDAYSYKSRADFPEVKSISSGDLGVQISFGTFEDEFRGNLVFSGENGDFVWGKNKGFQTINDEYHIVWKNSEIGLCEAHLHQEFIPVPMTSYGITHWTDLYRISNSEEMKPWSVGSDYDRPIPRRILEEKGLPRESFGMKKYGAGFYYAYDWKKRLLSRLSENSAKEFEKYLQKNQCMAPLKNYMMFMKVNAKMYFNTMMTKLKIQKIHLQIKDYEVEKMHSVPNPFAMRYLIPWGGSHMIREYEKKLRKTYD